MMTVWLPVVTLLACAFLLIAGPAEAQQAFSFTGTVQWASATSMQVMADNGATVSLDLSRADQTSYTSLRGGDRVRVYGYLSADRRQVVAVDIRREEYNTQSP
jgi:hypothetical protein